MEMTSLNTELSDDVATDVFAAARWFDSLWNSTARAVGPNEIEWRCSTWGSGRGRGDWNETAIFILAAAAFNLRTWRNYDGRDELVVAVPLDRAPHLGQLIDRIGEEAEAWPWLNEEDPDRQLDVAAETLGLSTAAVVDDANLLEALGIE